jgi:hypothetical protein
MGVKMDGWVLGLGFGVLVLYIFCTGWMQLSPAQGPKLYQMDDFDDVVEKIEFYWVFPKLDQVDDIDELEKIDDVIQ